MRESSSREMKKWHSKMKQNNPDKYYEIQHSRFRRVGNKKLKTKNGEFVKNKLELYFANLLFKNNIKYEFEPEIKISNKTYFPDFKVGKILVECTYWKGKDKAIQLKKKNKTYKSAGFKPFVLIPKRLESFYKCIQKQIVMTECSP